jgi:hypothetical protein
MHFVRRPRGRPRFCDEPMVSVSTCLPVSQYDTLTKQASAQSKTIAEALRDLLLPKLK